jgi:hypothetical protein
MAAGHGGTYGGSDERRHYIGVGRSDERTDWMMAGSWSVTDAV